MIHPENSSTFASPPPAPSISRLRRGTWIVLLSVGLLTTMIGLCMGGLMCGTSWMVQVAERDAATAASQPATSRAAPLLWAMTTIAMATPLATGIVEILCGVKIRGGFLRGAAAVVAAVIVALQIVIAILMMAASVSGVFTDSREAGLAQSMVVSLLFFAAVCGVLGYMEWLLIKLIREKPDAARPV